MSSIQAQCQAAHAASRILVGVSTETKNRGLEAMADALRDESKMILEQNQIDLESGKQNGLSAALLDRLMLNTARIHGMADSILAISKLEDPIGAVMASWVRPNGLKISQVRVPFGVIGIIYEARPNVTADAIALCLKTSNAVVLRGSASAYRSNAAITIILKNAAQKSGLPADSIQLLEDTSKEGVVTLVKMKPYLSLVIPRGGASLIQTVIENATVPSLETGVGNCHLFVDASADIKKAVAILINAKVQRPSVCNACETLLVHQAIANEFLPKAIAALRQSGVEIRGCERTKKIDPLITPATEADWATEFLDLIIAIKIVDSLDDAIAHITRYGTMHSETIISNDPASIARFKQSVDAAAVLVNASSRFVDGGEFGFGAEMGISTQKLHARGPMGLKELTTYKYIVEGNGQVRG